MVHSTYTVKNAMADIGIACARQSTRPVRKKPKKNLILLPA